MTTEPTKEIIEARRRFLQQCGKFSIATPPAVALLLATADRSYAATRSGGFSPQNNGFQGNNFQGHDRGGNDRGGNDRGGDRGDRGHNDGPRGR